MKIQTRTFGVGAVLLAVSALVACGGQDTAGKGQVAIVLSGSGGAPSALSSGSGSGSSCPALQSAKLTFGAIVARTLDGKLVDVTISLPATVDVLTLGKGKDVTLPIGFLPPGTYDQFVVVMTELEVTLANGTKVAITPPGGGFTAVVPVAQPFTVVANQTTTVTLAFRRDLSFVCGLGRWDFHPEFECHGADRD